MDIGYALVMTVLDQFNLIVFGPLSPVMQCNDFCDIGCPRYTPFLRNIDEYATHENFFISKFLHEPKSLTDTREG